MLVTLKLLFANLSNFVMIRYVMNFVVQHYVPVAQAHGFNSQERQTQNVFIYFSCTVIKYVMSLSLCSFSKGKRSNLRRSSVQMTLNAISELVMPRLSTDSSESLMEEPSRRTRRTKTTAPAETEPVKRSTRNKAGAKAKEVAESIPDENKAIEVQDQILISEAVVKIPSSERLSADTLLNAGVSPGRSANKIPIAASGLQTTPQGSSRTSARRSLVVRRSLVGLRHSMTQEAVRRASRRSFLKKKARLGNSTCSSSISGETFTFFPVTATKLYSYCFKSPTLMA